MKFAVLSLSFLLSVSFAQAGNSKPHNRPIDAQKYKIDWEVNPAEDPSTFQAEVTATFKAKAPLESFTLDIDNLKINSVTDGGKKALTFTPKEGAVEIALAKKVAAGASFTVKVRYEGKIGTSHEGLFKVTDPDDASRGPMLFTQFESQAARSFFPCNDEPYDKAITEVVTRAPEKYEVVSNGVRAKDRFFKKGDGRWKEVRYTMPLPHSTYLVAVGVAPLTKIADRHGKKEVNFWVADKKVDAAKFGIEATKRLMGFYEKYLGTAYPWPKYDTVGIPTFLWGGMENTSATFMNQERILLNDPSTEFEKNGVVGLTAHELAHQWFGDFVTMAWWDDIWLNESFASYLGTLGERDFFNSVEPELNVIVSSWDEYFREEDGPRSHPIVDKNIGNPDDHFDTISYTKGENVLRMLHHYIGDAPFRKGLATYLKKHGLGNATYLDFFARMEAASGQSLVAFRDTWLLQRGYPVIKYSGTWDTKASSYKLTINQQSNHPEDKTTFHFKLPVVFHRKATPAYSKSMDLVLGEPQREETVKLLAEPEWVTVNPGAVVLSRIEQEKRDEGALSAQALGDPDPVARTWASYNLAGGLLEGKSVSALAERTLLTVLEQDPSPYVRNALLEGLIRAKSRWLPESLANGVFALAKTATSKGYAQAAAFASDPHGWSQWRSHLHTVLGKVNQPGALPFLAEKVGKRDISLDDLKCAARAIAMLGTEESSEVLKTTAQLQGPRGYRFRYSVQYALGYYENPKAADDIRELAKTAGTDIMARIGWAVSYNETLKNSSEWADFLQEFILKDTKFGETVKSRLLSTIEDVKTSDVKKLLQTLMSKSDSARIKEAAKKILDKNFLSAEQAATNLHAAKVAESSSAAPSNALGTR